MNCPRRHTCWRSRRLYWEGASRWRAVGWGSPGGTQDRTALSHGSQSQVLWWWINFQVFFGQALWLRVLPGGARIAQPRWMPERILGVGRIYSDSFWPFLNSSGWWWLISSMFLTRTSCHKITHENGYCGAWPGWMVSVSVFPLTWLWLSMSTELHAYFLRRSQDPALRLYYCFLSIPP